MILQHPLKNKSAWRKEQKRQALKACITHKGMVTRNNADVLTLT
jgi:hypothetical protein